MTTPLVYAKCMTGLEDVWISRMADTLHLEDDPQERGQQGDDPSDEDRQR
jgi:hypothetical protein